MKWFLCRRDEIPGYALKVEGGYWWTPRDMTATVWVPDAEASQVLRAIRTPKSKIRVEAVADTQAKLNRLRRTK